MCSKAALPLIEFTCILAALGLCGNVYVYWYRRRQLPPEPALADAIRQDIAQVKAGRPTKIVGTVRLAETPLEAPLTGRECACYQVRVEERPRKGDPDDIVSSLVYKPFFLKDASGEAYIDPSRVRAVLVTQVVSKARFLGQPSPEAIKLLESHGQELGSGLGTNRKLDFCEGVLQEGDVVAVYGTGTWEAAGTADYRQKVSRLRLGSNVEGPLLVSDHPAAMKR